MSDDFGFSQDAQQTEAAALAFLDSLVARSPREGEVVAVLPAEELHDVYVFLPDAKPYAAARRARPSERTVALAIAVLAAVLVVVLLTLGSLGVGAQRRSGGFAVAESFEPRGGAVSAQLRGLDSAGKLKEARYVEAQQSAVPYGAWWQVAEEPEDQPEVTYTYETYTYVVETPVTTDEAVEGVPVDEGGGEAEAAAGDGSGEAATDEGSGETPAPVDDTGAGGGAAEADATQDGAESFDDGGEVTVEG